VDGSGAWWKHDGHLAMNPKSLMTSMKNPHMGGMGSFPINVGWNVEWNRDIFYSSEVIFN
jgi:hypothetical protein